MAPYHYVYPLSLTLRATTSKTLIVYIFLNTFVQWITYKVPLLATL